MKSQSKFVWESEHNGYYNARHLAFLWSAPNRLSFVWAFLERAVYPLSRKPNQGARSPNLILQSASLCLRIFPEGQKEGGSVQGLFCTYIGTARPAGVRPGGGKNRTVSGTVDNAFCHHQTVGFGQRIIRLDGTGVPFCPIKVILINYSLIARLIFRNSYLKKQTCLQRKQVRFYHNS